MSEQGELTPTILEEGRTEPESAPENGILKSESLDEEEKLELQVSYEDLSLAFRFLGVSEAALGIWSLRE